MNSDTQERMLPILIGEQRRCATIPFPMDEEDFEMMISTLALWKRRLVLPPAKPPIEFEI